MKRTPLRRTAKIGGGKIKSKHDARWLAVRKLVCWRAQDTCEQCGRPTPLNQGDGHHLQQRSTHPELKYELSNVAWLCRCCHSKAHEAPKAVPKKEVRAREEKQDAD